MFNIFRTLFTSTPKEPPALTTDLHSHLIPGIDDGSQSGEDADGLQQDL